MKFYKKGGKMEKTVGDEGKNEWLKLLHFMISVKCKISFRMVQKLKGLVHTKRRDGISN